jgi:hypothetical protein
VFPYRCDQIFLSAPLTESFSFFSTPTKSGLRVAQQVEFYLMLSAALKLSAAHFEHFNKFIFELVDSVFQLFHVAERCKLVLSRVSCFVHQLLESERDGAGVFILPTKQV